MRFLFFETFKFPSAVVTALLDKAKLQDLLVSKPVSLPLRLMVDLHGIKKAMTVQVAVARSGTNAVSVTSVSPVEVQAADFALSEGVARLSQVAGGIDILPTAWLNFAFAFEGTNNNPQLDAVRTAAENRRAQETTRSLTSEECDNRMDVISKTRQIYFKTGSADLDSKESAPVLNEVAQFTNRCPEVAIEISGHTDMDGAKDFNQKLSEQRAHAVADALAQRGVLTARMKALGYGFSRPVADNISEAGKQQNRRIEFRRAD
jgi:outer membrane protein OmpA-like peptidoglycan-associated protein